MEQKIIPLIVKDDNPNQLQLQFQGRLDIQSVPNLWLRCMALKSKYNPNLMTVLAHNLEYCDGAGIALLLALKQRQEADGHQFQLQGLNPKFQQLMSLMSVESSKTNNSETIEAPQYRLPIGVGKFVSNILYELRENIIFLGCLSLHLVDVVRHPKSLHWKNLWVSLENTGPNALPITCLVGFLIGLISAFQAAIPLGTFGAQIYIANLVGISLVKELAPLMVAVLLAGRTASAFAAEIGTMKVNQEIDALATMGLDTVKFLAVPKVVATTLVAPILNIFLIIFGLIGCGIVMNLLGFNLNIYLEQLKSAVTLSNFIGGLIKTFVFGFLIAGIGCLQGLKTKMNASGVGNSTTQAVVISIITIIMVDGIFACIYYILGF